MPRIDPSARAGTSRALLNPRSRARGTFAITATAALALLAGVPCVARAARIAGEILPESENPPQTCIIRFWRNRPGGERARIGTCSATLITPSSLLTAGHCRTRTADAEITTVECPGEGSREVVSKLGHSNAMGFSQDLAVFRVSRPFSATPMRLVSGLEEQEKLLAAPQNCIIAGWGQDESGKSGALRAAQTSSLTPDFLDLSCLCVRRNQVRIDAKSLVRFGDSGGTLACRTKSGERVLVGVLSELHDWKSGTDFSAAELLVPSLAWTRYAIGSLNPSDNRTFDEARSYERNCLAARGCLQDFEAAGTLSGRALMILEKMKRDLVDLELRRAHLEQRALEMSRRRFERKLARLRRAALELYEGCTRKSEPMPPGM